MDVPRSRSESLMCSYCRARFVPFFVPRGGIAASFVRLSPLSYPRSAKPQTGFRGTRTGNYWPAKRAKGDTVYIGGGALALIVLILLLIWIF
jgi:hypothetical protein